MHDGHPIDTLLDLGQRVRGHQHRRAARAQAVDGVEHLHARGRIEPAGRLIEQQQPGLADQCLGDAQALAHAFGIGGHAPPRGRGNADACQQVRVARGRTALQARVEGHQFDCRHGAVKRHVLGQEAQRAPRLGAAAPCRVLALYLDPSRAGADQPQQQLDQRRLAGAVVADQRRHLARSQRQTNVLDGDQRPVALGDLDPLRDRRHGSGTAGLGTRTGRISGALSKTPPGYSAGKRACAQRTSCTAGLLVSSLACGRVQRISSMTSLGR